MDKREARRAYKERKAPKGVYAIRCTGSADVWVNSSTHLDTERNSLWAQLRGGAMLNKALQAAWNAHGESSFQYEILETLNDDAAASLFVKDLLSERQKHWQNALGARSLF